MTADDPDADSSVELWREAFEVSGRLSDLDEVGRTQELEVLNRMRPDLYPHIVQLLVGRGRAADEGPLTREFSDAMHAVSAAASAASPRAGTVLGSYTLVRLLGQGGMGEVWLAGRTDGRYQGDVAVKMLHQHLGHAEVRERFIREGQIAARLAHPHIARLYDAGATTEGLLYLVFEYVQGERIDRWCDARRLDIPARVRLFLDVCEAVAQAHAHLIVHRDIKPSNIMVTADGQVKLLDFGIAKLIAAETLSGNQTELTKLGGRALTPEYAAPEQVLGAAITTVTDVYSLGVLLYVLLSGNSPYGDTQSTSAQLERHIVETDPRSLATAAFAATVTATSEAADDSGPVTRAAHRSTTPARLKKALGGDLETIIGKALKKTPAERYLSVLALADDLRRYLDNKPVQARPDAFGYRLAKFARRNRTGTAAAAVVLVAVAAGIGGVAWQAQRAEREAVRARRVKEFLVSIFEASTPAEAQRHDVSARDLLDHGAAEIEHKLGDDPVVQADLYDALAQIELSLGDARQSLHYAESGLSLRRKTLSPTDPRIGDSLVEQGHAIFLTDVEQQSEIVPAEILTRSAQAFTEAAQLYSEASGDHRLQRARALSGLAEVEINLGARDKALRLHEQALALFRAALGPSAPEALDEQLIYAENLQVSGRYLDAERETRSAITGLIASYGPNHSKVGDAQTELSFQLFLLNRNEEALQVISPAIATLTRVYGANSMPVAAARSIRGMALLELHRFSESDADFAAALSIYKPGTYMAARNHRRFGLSLMAQERYQEAIREFRTALDGYLAVASSDDPETFAAKTSLGAAELYSGDAIQGTRQLRQATAEIIQHTGDKSHDAQAPAQPLGIALLWCGHPKEAAEMLHDLVAFKIKELGTADSPSVAATQYWLGEALLAGGSAPDAPELRYAVEHALPLLRKTLDPLTVPALLLAARVDRANGNVARAETELREAIGSLDEKLHKLDATIGPLQPAPSLRRYQLAQAFAMLGDPRAGSLFDQAVAGLTHSAPNHCLLGNVLLDRARWRRANGQSSAAKLDLRSAVAAIERNQGPDSVYLQQANALLAQTK